MNLIIPNQSSDPDALFKAAWDFTVRHHAPDVEWLMMRDRKSCNIPEEFFETYVWVVYVSGFNASIVAQKWELLRKAWMQFNPYMCEKNQYLEANRVISNEMKNQAITKISQEIRACGSHFHEKFSLKYLEDRYKMQRLPYIGGVTSFHLARNLGFHEVKPDLHLERLRKHFGFGSTDAMCRQLSNSNSVDLPLVDLALFVYASHKFVKRKGCCGLSVPRLR